MELRQLRYFVAVAEELHFGRAAARVHIAQPPLSQQIKGLEAELGVLLLQRTRRSVALTPAGAAFLEQARDILARAGQAAETARRVQAGEEGRLAVGFVNPAMDAFLARTVAAFRTRRPGVALTLVEAATVEQVEEVRAGRLDLGFIRLYGEPPAGLAVRLACREPYVLALPRGHRLARRDRVALFALQGEPVILTPARYGAALRAAMLTALARAGATPAPAQEARTKQTALSLVAAGAGLALVPESSRVWRREGVVFRPVEEGLPLVEMAAILPARGSHPLAREMAELAREFGEMGNPEAAPGQAPDRDGPD
jgi:DNA-binding transcriptional LysR family regulator